MPIYLDTETWSAIDLKKSGTYKCAEHGRVILIAIGLNDEPVEVFNVFHKTIHDVLPQKYLDALLHSDEPIYAVNAMFDRTFMRLGADAMDIPPERWRCVMTHAWRLGLPGSLESLGGICKLKTDEAKDKAGYALMKLFSFPTSTATPESHPVEWANYAEYCRRDVVAMKQVIAKLPKLPDADPWREYHIDQRINDHGFLVDSALIEHNLDMVSVSGRQFDKIVQDSTFGIVESASKRAQILGFLNTHYLQSDPLPDLQATTIDSYLNRHPELSPDVRDILLARASGGAASVKKWAVLDKMATADGRIRGTLIYYGANRTGRWAGRGFQPHNLPRPKMKHQKIETIIDKVYAGDAPELLDPFTAIAFAQDSLRSAIIPGWGNKLLVADLANIEGRVLAWIAGESWKLQAFRDYDAGTGPDLYKMAYAKAFGKSPANVTDHERQIGKVLELAMGYLGGVGAFTTFAITYGVDLQQLADSLKGSIPEDIREECARGWEWASKQNRTLDLPKDVYQACDALKRMWRYAHPETVQLWDALKMGMITADANEGEVISVHHSGLFMRKFKGFLQIRLPSKRTLMYPGFHITMDTFKAEDDYDAHIYNLMFRFSEFKGKVHALQRTYAGKITENIVQAVARDVLMMGIANAQNAGLPVVLHVHDEIVCEVPDQPEYSVGALIECMTRDTDWTAGLPLAAAGFEAYRYRK